MGNNCCSAKPSAKGIKAPAQPPQNLKPATNAMIISKMNTESSTPAKETEDTPRGKSIEMAPNQQDISDDRVVNIYK